MGQQLAEPEAQSTEGIISNQQIMSFQVDFNPAILKAQISRLD